MRSLAVSVTGLVLVPLLSACDPCAGTASCHITPEASVGGQFIERKSGATVPGVMLEFVRKSGAQTDQDTARAITDRDGFFQLRLGAIENGNVTGDLRVTPPSPWPEFVVEGMAIPTTRTRGNGSNLGRVVVNPYVMLVGDVYDRKTGTPDRNPTVTLHRLSGAQLATDPTTLATDPDGRVTLIEPAVAKFGVIHAEMGISAPGYPRTYRVKRDIPVHFRDGNITIIGLPMGFGLQQTGVVARRGNDARLPGVLVEFKRTSGLAVNPTTLTLTARDDGFFVINLDAPDTGTVTGDLTITPPAPYPKEVLRGVVLVSMDDDNAPTFGTLGFGTQVYLSAYFQPRTPGLRLAGLLAQVTRTGGMATLAPPADAGIRGLSGDGRLVYSAATADTGTVQYSLIVNLPAPFPPETLKAVAVPSRYSDDPTELGVFRVGSWYPWQGIVVDAVNSQPIAGVTATFRRTGGAALANETITSQSDANGAFPLQPIPRERGTVTGTLTLSMPGYSTLVVTGVQLQTAENDALRTTGTYRLQRP